MQCHKTLHQSVGQEGCNPSNMMSPTALWDTLQPFMSSMVWWLSCALDALAKEGG